MDLSEPNIRADVDVINAAHAQAAARAVDSDAHRSPTGPQRTLVHLRRRVLY